MLEDTFERNFEYIEKKLRTVDPTLFCKAFLDVEIPKRSNWVLLKRVWKKSRGNAIVFVLLSPFAFFQRRKLETLLRKYNQIFIESNEKLKKTLPKAEKENEKMFMITFIDLNTVAIKMNSLILEENEKISKAKKLKKIFTQNPTTENLLNLWSIMKDILVLEIRIARLQSEKAGIQDKVIEYEKEMTKFDKRDIEDFWRAILTDLMISYYEQKIMIVGTPIEVLLKSNKIMNRVRKTLFLSEVLRENAKLREESQNKLIKWFITYED